MCSVILLLLGALRLTRPIQRRNTAELVQYLQVPSFPLKATRIVTLLYSTSSAVASKIVTWPTDGKFHALKAELRTIAGNTKDLSIAYYLDGSLQATHTAANFCGAAMWLIIDLQVRRPNLRTPDTYRIYLSDGGKFRLSGTGGRDHIPDQKRAVDQVHFLSVAQVRFIPVFRLRPTVPMLDILLVGTSHKHRDDGRKEEPD